MTQTWLNIVLLNPEIPNNTGNIGRTCAATGCRLHLIHPLGFDLSEKARRRAGLDYWPLVDCIEHASFNAYLEHEQPKRLWLLTTHATRPLWEAKIDAGDHFLFGKETAGVPQEIHDLVKNKWGENARLTLPMVNDPRARSLNLATTVCGVVYEAMRQIQPDITTPPHSSH
ncbi:MAG: tRNA (cytidine(34)-2'-O)-methyltransferase [Phycisphaerales bacterium]|jgi:tRNA (cytidine/uridine-2'-O-)-methyltransferase|nr:tRNA (cytidine(34)-2'-O)-methyltransferase [Phycisphaerales bacterium]